MSKPSSAVPSHTQLPPVYQQQPSSSSPSYGATNIHGGLDHDPLLGSQSHDDDDDVPEDFKIGVTVSQSSKEVRMQFVRKVYIVLSLQLAATFGVGLLMRGEATARWTQEHTGLMFLPMIGAFASMLGAFWKRHSHPLNIVFLSAFTAFEAITVGAVISFYEQGIVLAALGITLTLFVGLTLFTLQSRYEFDSMGPYLFTGLLAFFLSGLVGLFIPFSNTVDLVMASVGVLLFSMYIIYDTHRLMKKLHVDDWVLASISLYLDFINLFFQVLRLLSDIQDR